MKDPVLILAYKFAPYEGVGARRWTKFSKYLVQLNINVHVITNNWKGKGENSWSHDIHEKLIIKKFQTPFNIFKSKNHFLNKITIKIEHLFSKWFVLTDEGYLFYVWNYKKIKKYIADNDIKYIIATGAPFSTNYFASKLKKEIPSIILIQDFRDLWMEVYFTEHPDRNSEHPFFIKEKKMKEFTLHHSDVFVSVTPGYLSRLEHNSLSNGVMPKQHVLIENGFDDDDKILFSDSDFPYKIFSKNDFNISHFGTADFGRDTEFLKFIESIASKLLSVEGKNIRFHFFGNCPDHFKKSIERMGLSKNISFYNFMPPNEIQKYMNFSDMHLVINDPVCFYAYGTKVYDAFMYRKPVLLICKEDGLYHRIKDNFIGLVTDTSVLQNQELFDSLIKNISKITANKYFNNEYDFDQFSISKLTNEYIKLLSEAKVIPPRLECSRCIMSSDNDPDLVLNELGVCNHCLNYEAEQKKIPVAKIDKQAEFDRQIAEIKENGKGKKYDAILGVSGGVDSTYLAWICKEQGLRVLFVHCDNGWNSELSVMNIQNLCTKTGFDLYTHVLDWPSFKDLQLSFIKAGVVDIELPYDYALYVLMFTVAKKYNIKTVLSGHNLVTEGTYMPKSWVHDKLDLKNILDIHKKFGTIPLKKFPKMGIIKFLYYKKRNILKNYKLLNYIDYNKSEVKEFIKNELGWRDYGGKHYESVFTRFFQGYILPKKFHIDKRQYHLSALVQSGQISRDEALIEMNTLGYNKEQFEIDYEYVLKKFNLTAEEFDAFMNAPIKKHTDYANIKTFWIRYFKFIRTVKKILLLKVADSDVLITKKNTSKILVICYSFPPFQGIGGRRWAKFSKYLTKSNYDIYVIGALNREKKKSIWNNDVINNNKIHYYPIKTKFYTFFHNYSSSFLNKIRFQLIKNWIEFFWIGNYYDKALPSNQLFYKKAKKLIIEESIINIVITIAPNRLVEVGKRLKEEFPHINLIIDIRDPWNICNEEWDHKHLSDERKEHELMVEYNSLMSADKVFTVSDFLTDHYKLLFKTTPDKFVTIPNGFDKEEIFNSKFEKAKLPSDKLKIVFTGTLYDNVTEVFEEFVIAVKSLNIEHEILFKDIEFHFYIPRLAVFENMVLKHDCKNILFFDYIPLPQIQQVINESFACILFLSPNYEFSLSTKFFEYMTKNKKILVFSNPGLVVDLVTEHNLGYVMKPKSVKNNLLHAIINLKKNDAQVTSTFDLESYSILNLTEQMKKYFV